MERVEKRRHVRGVEACGDKCSRIVVVDSILSESLHTCEFQLPRISESYLSTRTSSFQTLAHRVIRAMDVSFPVSSARLPSI